MKKHLTIIGLSVLGLGLITLLGISLFIYSVQKDLPQLITVSDYKPLLVSEVYDRKNKKIGEFFREKRTLLPYEEMPKQLINAFLAAEDDQFFEHSGINMQAIMRAAIANMRAGRSVQGGSTITQQVAKTLLLTSEKTLIRKVKDILLALEMEKNLSKEDILFLYLNQIFFGQGAYGIEEASRIYFRKPAKDMKVEEMALMAGLPQAPSRYSPVRNPKRAKERQIYVLNRMADVGFITKEEAKIAIENPVTVYIRENYVEMAPYYLETIRQVLVDQLGESMVLDKGIKVHTGLDLDAQLTAQASVEKNLKDLDKRQGFRGPLRSITDAEQKALFLEEYKTKLVLSSTPQRVILPTGVFDDISPPAKKGNLPSYLKVQDTYEAIVAEVNDSLGLVTVDLPETQGLIEFQTMTWARKPNTDVRFDNDLIKKPSEALKVGDVIKVRLIGPEFKNALTLERQKKSKKLNFPDFKNYLELELDQDPQAEGALISFDQNTQDVVAMVGGYSFARSEFNRALQAPRQTGSAFKALVYAAALEKGFTASTKIMDAPIVYKEGSTSDEGQGDEKVWKPSNFGKNFQGDILMRNALVRSLNIPTVKIMEDLGVPWAVKYSQRMGIYSPLNPDYTLALGSSGVTLYEMTKAFSLFGRNGKKIRPRLIHKVTDPEGNLLLEKVSLDARFAKEVNELENQLEEERVTFINENPDRAEAKARHFAAKPNDRKIEDAIYFTNPEQLIRPETAYIMNEMLKGTVSDPAGTAVRAASLGREIAGKTGSTNGYYDAWFIGYTPQIATGVWVGFDKEQPLGVAEVGGRSALPIWMDYMKGAWDNLPQMTFQTPEGIVFASVDYETGRLTQEGAANSIKLPFIEGTEPKASDFRNEEATDFYKQDLEE